MRNPFARRQMHEIPLRPYTVQIHDKRISTGIVVRANSPQDAVRRLRKDLRQTDYVVGRRAVMLRPGSRRHLKAIKEATA